MESIFERLRAHGWHPEHRVDYVEGDCWISDAPSRDYGYARFKLAGKMHECHRVAYQMHVGPIPPGMRVCHKCDVRDCVNPNHLFLGTAKDNAQDMMRKGRRRGGPPKGVPTTGNRKKMVASTGDPV